MPDPILVPRPTTAVFYHCLHAGKKKVIFKAKFLKKPTILWENFYRNEN